ncbi:MAG: histidinol-phosphate transaminase, partial [Gammaproteobacteria bacterium]|nr:histidinol-phosphate transaminase [Gammaproteobacteria bacterium]
MPNKITDLIAHLVRPEIRSLSAYHVPDAHGLVKLDAMENPYSWPEEIKQAWLEALRDAPLNRYPDPEAHALKDKLRAAQGVPAEAGLLLGNGSDELIQMLALALAQPGRVMLAPEPGFVMYRLIALWCGMNYVGVPLRNDFTLDLDAMLEAIQRHQPALVFIAYPNNPTGNLFDEQALHRIIEQSPGLVVLDEAYHAFAGASFMPDVMRYPNLLVMRTLSKMGLAGLRLGLLAGHPNWLDEINKTRLPYNINVLTQLSVEFALRHVQIMENQARLICAERERLLAELGKLGGVTAYPSRANFILFRTAAGGAVQVFNALRQSGVLIKNLHGANPLLDDCL